jgi:hypothetical protein
LNNEKMGFSQDAFAPFISIGYGSFVSVEASGCHTRGKGQNLNRYHLRPYHPLSHRDGNIASKIGIPNKKRILKGAK